MSATQTHYTVDELARLGADVFEQQVRSALRPEDNNKFVAIDVHSGDYEIDEDDYTAVMRLRARRTPAKVWLGRVGQPAACEMMQDS